MSLKEALLKYAQHTVTHSAKKEELDREIAPYKEAISTARSGPLGLAEKMSRGLKENAYKEAAAAALIRFQSEVLTSGHRFTVENVGYVDVSPNASAVVVDLAALLEDPVARRCITSVKIDAKVAAALAQSGHLPGIALKDAVRISVKEYERENSND